MKIVITVNSLTKGSGLSKYIYNLCNVLRDDSNNMVHIITTHAVQPEFEANVFKEDARIKLHQLHMYTKYWRYIKLMHLFRKLNADLIIINYHALSQYVLPLCKRSAKAVHVIHGETPDFYRIAAINGNSIDGWITPTIGVKNRFNTYTHNIYEDRVTAIPHGVESPRRYGVVSHRGERLEIVFTGVLYEHKGVLTLPAIVAKLKENDVDFHFSIIGKGILADELKQQMIDSITDGSVEFTGVISAYEVYQRMSNAHIFLYPTQIDSFGLVIAEAMMNGAVPIVSHLKDITDVLIDDGKNGYLISSPKDAGAFAEKIMELNNDREKLLSMSDAAKCKAESDFTIENFQENYTNYFNEILK